MANLIYIGSPYTHPEEEVMEERYRKNVALVAEAFNQNRLVYSPIAHCHPVAQEYDLDRTINFWWRYNRLILDRSDILWVHQLRGWNFSNGLNKEISYAKSRGIPIRHVKPFERGGYIKFQSPTE